MIELVERIFKVIDNKDATGFAAFFSDDAVFKFGNAPAISGKANIHNAVADFFSKLKGLKHRIQDVWLEDDVIICEGEVTYMRKDDDKLTLPFADILRMRDGLIVDYRIYMDVSPLFA